MRPLPIHLLAYDAVRRAVRRYVAPSAAGPGQWYILLGQAAIDDAIGVRTQELKAVLPATDRFWADPFVWKKDGVTHIFCEEWIVGEPHAHISVVIPSPDGPSTAEPVLQQPYHLSYPFLFSFEDDLYMIPESSAARSIDVYRCDEFPGRWKKVHTIMSGVDAADATLVEHQGRWWLFTAFRERLTGGHNSLYAFHAESPLSSNWIPHSMNPIVRSHRSGRPGGRILEVEGDLYRPAQDSSLRYGYGLRWQHVTELSPTGFSEKTVALLTPWAKDVLGCHHVDWHDGLVVIDAQRPAR